MMSRNFRATVKEGREGEPCGVWLEMHEEIGLGFIQIGIDRILQVCKILR